MTNRKNERRKPSESTSASTASFILLEFISFNNMPATTTTTNTTNQSNTLGTSSKENIIDLCTLAGEVFSKFGLLLKDLEMSNQRAISLNNQEQQLIGWDEQCVIMFRQAVQTFAMSVRDISTTVAEKRIRER